MEQNNKNIQKIWTDYKDHHATEGYQLKNVVDVYLPFWECKQNIVIEKEIELDRFSRIILEFIQNGVSKHREICAFLGIEEDSFVNVQFHFLIKNDMIRETEMGEYEITHEGVAFLQNKVKVKNIETIEFEYFVTDKVDYLKNDLTQEFFDPKLPIDIHLSVGKKREFSGYIVMQTHQIQKSKDAKVIPHHQKPVYRHISENRNDFSNFLNKQFKDKNFYDFADQSIEVHKRSICFYGLFFEKRNAPNEGFWEIRHSPKSIKSFKNCDLEEKLTEKVKTLLNEKPEMLK